MKGVYKTPGVYIEEKNAFTTSIVAVPTAIPAFIGHTEKAIRGTKLLTGIPTRVTSFTEFQDLFGGAPSTNYKLEDGENGQPYKLTEPANQFYLYNSMKLFYTNGGGPCWIVSVGSYSDPLDSEKFKTEGLDKLKKIMEPTMLVSPDAVLFPAENCFAFQSSMIEQSGVLRDRIAILDVHGGNLEDGKGGYKDELLREESEQPFFKLSNENAQNQLKLIDRLRASLNPKTPDFGAVYYPWLHTSTTGTPEVGSANIHADSLPKLKELIEAEAQAQLDQGGIKQEGKDVTVATVDKLIAGTAELKTARETSDQEGIAAANGKVMAAEQAISAVSPLYKEILKDIRTKLNVLPPSGAIAGLISQVDETMGVAHAPANMGLSSVTAPTISISSEDQENLNLPLNGKAVNAIRSFPGRGVLVWGARTLDGNSQDWRYISVRRAVIMIEQSVKIALAAFVFEPNNQNTWLDVQGSITNFLTTQWSNGVLAGATPADAFEVSVGLGATMTPNDILDGIMRISVKLAVTRPAEFIVVTFQQKMQTS